MTPVCKYRITPEITADNFRTSENPKSLDAQLPTTAIFVGASDELCQIAIELMEPICSCAFPGLTDENCTIALRHQP